MKKQRQAFRELFNKKKVRLPMILAKFSCIDLKDLLKTFKKYFSNDFYYIISHDDYMTDLNYFLMDFVKDNIKTEEDLYYLRTIISEGLDNCKNYLKPYNKKEKKKDELYIKTNKLKSFLQFDLDFIDNILLDNYTDYLDAKIINFIIFELKNPDYVFRLAEKNPELINTTDANGDKVFNVLVNYYIDNVYKLSDEDLTYYKRVFMILLESDALFLKNDELSSCYDNLNSCYHRSNNKNIKYLIDLIKIHYPNLNSREKVNCIDFIDVKPPTAVILINKDERVDLTNEFTITIDGLRNKKLTNTLFDDAFTIKGSGNDLHILISVPDVDLFIERDSDLDKFMRSLGESVYAKDYKKALIEYDFAKNMSLEKGMKRNCITFDISVDSEANIKGIDFYKSVVKVNYNLTKDKADELMKYHDFDDRLNVLNKMYDLSVKLCRKRKDMIGRRTPAKLIMDEFNILPDLVTADYFFKNGIVFPYKNYLGKLKSGSRKHILKINEFIQENELNDESIDMLNSILDIYNRVFYDTINYGNKTYKGKPCGSVGNPMREYISLETDRLIKDLLINNLNNYDYWLERANRDCIEYTETSAKIRTLYDSKKGR